MALQTSWLATNTQVQAPTAYARIITMHIDAIAQTVDLTVGLYVTAAARTAGAAPYDIFHAWPPYIQFLGQPIDVRAAAYNWLVANVPAFAGAISV
jgi:hypothetical protein